MRKPRITTRVCQGCRRPLSCYPVWIAGRITYWHTRCLRDARKKEVKR